MPTLLVLQQVTLEAQEQIRAAAPGWSCIFGKAKELDPQLFREAEVICGWSSIAAQETLGRDVPLRWVQSWAAGVDKLPLELFRKQGIRLTDASGIHPVPMSETAFALMLGLNRNIQQAVRDQSAAVWGKGGSFRELHGSTVGIIGAGEIGRQIARLSRAFGMTVLGVRRSGQPTPEVDEMYGLDELDTVLRRSDYIVNILPLTAQTRDLFDEARFGLMKRGACFINIGRGATVVTSALVEALESGQLGSAGLDVIEPEPLPEDHPLWSMEQVILTPHIGGASPYYDARASQLFISNLALYAQGKPELMRNIVDYNSEY